MKRFSHVLKALMMEHKHTQRSLGTLSTLHFVKVGRLASGSIRADREDLAALFNAYTAQEDRFRLLLAHIQDEIPETGLNGVTISPSQPLGALHDHDCTFPPDISPVTRSAIQHLLANMREIPTIEDVIKDLAKLVGWLETVSIVKKPARSRARFVEVADVPPPVKYPPAKRPA